MSHCRNNDDIWFSSFGSCHLNGWPTLRSKEKNSFTPKWSNSIGEPTGWPERRKCPNVENIFCMCHLTRPTLCHERTNLNKTEKIIRLKIHQKHKPFPVIQLPNKQANKRSNACNPRYLKNIINVLDDFLDLRRNKWPPRSSRSQMRCIDKRAFKQWCPFCFQMERRPHQNCISQSADETGREGNGDKKKEPRIWSKLGKTNQR